MGWIFLLAALAADAAALFAVTRQLHMLQLNSYFTSRYAGWLKGAYHVRSTGALMLGGAMLLSLWLGKYGWIFLVLAGLTALIRILTALSDYKVAIKKIVFTARIKRMYVTAGLLLLALVVAAAFCPGVAGRVLLSVNLLLGVCTPALALLAKWINTPVEAAVKQYYIRDAKKILRAHTGLQVIGITGSYGKTSTKYALAHMLRQKYNVVFTPGSFNTPMGIVRTVREQLQPTTQVFIAEMGAKNVGDIREICRIADPAMGVITSVGPQHLDTFGSLEHVANTKFELADWVTGNQGTVFLNTENAMIADRAGRYPRVVSYGTSQGNVRATDITYSRNGSSFTLVAGERRIPIATRLLGGHNVLNLTAAAAVGMELGLSDEEIRYAAASMQPVEHRLELKPFLFGSVLIDDAYNANPEGCLEAVRVLGQFAGMQKIIVTPGLVELGDREYQCNYALGLAAANTCDVIVLVGEKRAVPMADAIRTTDFPAEKLHIVPRFSDAMTLLQGFVNRDCAVLFENDLPDNYAG